MLVSRAALRYVQLRLPEWRTGERARGRRLLDVLDAVVLTAWYSAFADHVLRFECLSR